MPKINISEREMSALVASSAASTFEAGAVRRSKRKGKRGAGTVDSTSIMEAEAVLKKGRRCIDGEDESGGSSDDAAQLDTSFTSVAAAREAPSSGTDGGETPAKRHRGRPPTSGDYRQLAEEKERLAAAREREADAMAEKAIWDPEVMPRISGPRSKKILPPEDLAKAYRDKTSGELEEIARDRVFQIRKLADTGKNMKGTHISAFRVAAAVIEGVATVLGELVARSEDTAVAADGGTAVMSRMKARVDELDNELKTARAEIEKLRADAAAWTAPSREEPPSARGRRQRSPLPLHGTEGDMTRTPSPGMMREDGGRAPPPEEVPTSHLIGRKRSAPPGDGDSMGEARTNKILGRILERLDALEGRGGGRRADSAGRTERSTGRRPPPSTSTQNTIPPRSGEQGSGKRKNRKKKKRKGGMTEGATPPPTSNVRKGPAPPPARSGEGGARRAAQPPPPPPASTPAKPAQAGTWSEVVGRKAKRRDAAAAKAATAQTSQTGPGGRGGKGGKNKATIPRPPRLAAVTLTAVREGASLEAALWKAREKISLTDLGIVGGLRPKRAVTGGIIYEVPGPDSAQKAEALAKKLEEVLEEDGVRVARPVKRAELRITGLDDTATPQDIKDALAKAGKCLAEDVRVGGIRQARAGLKNVWVQCPQAAARLLAAAGKAQIGWVVARIEVLAARPLQCYRCLEVGHTGQRCTAGKDRSGYCYRCGQPGHTAGGCSAPPHCPVCADRGRPANHRVGGGACASSKPARGRGTNAPAQKPARREESALRRRGTLATEKGKSEERRNKEGSGGSRTGPSTSGTTTKTGKSTVREGKGVSPVRGSGGPGALREDVQPLPKRVKSSQSPTGREKEEPARSAGPGEAMETDH